MKKITYNGETHTFSEWCRILQQAAQTEYDADLQKFAEEIVIDDFISNKSLYETYTFWKGENAISKVSFEKQIPKIFRKFRPDLEQYRSCSVRGWRIVRQ